MRLGMKKRFSDFIHTRVYVRRESKRKEGDRQRQRGKSEREKEMSGYEDSIKKNPTQWKKK